MKIHTKVGDEGFTFRPGGRRVRKSDLSVEAVGAIDELNAHLGWCVQAAGQVQEVREALAPVQSELLTLGAILAAAGGKDQPAADLGEQRRAAGQPATAGRPKVALDEAAVARMEQQIDRITAGLPELAHFVLPGGCELACRLHVARTVCRRAERRVVASADAGAAVPPVVLRYVNRVSDLLFALARWANSGAGVNDAVWRG